MLVRKSIYKLNIQNLNYKIDSNCFEINKNFKTITINLYNKYFVKLSKNNINLIFLKKIWFQNFLISYKLLTDSFYSIYSYKLKLKGLGFRIKKLAKNLIKFTFNMTNYLYLYIPSSILILIRKRRLFFISTYWYYLKILITHILLLKNAPIYKSYGFSFPHRIRIFKPGKKRF